MMLEHHLRAIAEADLRRRFPQGRIIHELVLKQSTCRIDLAAVTPDHIALVEIKSDKDVIDRLRHQIDHATGVTRDITLYAGTKLRKQCEDICGFEIVQRYYADGGLEPCQFNRHLFKGHLRTLGRNTRHLFGVLWRPEMEMVLIRHGLDLPRKGNRNMITYTDIAIEHLTGGQIRRAVCQMLRERQFAKADDPVKQ